MARAVVIPLRVRDNESVEAGVGHETETTIHVRRAFADYALRFFSLHAINAVFGEDRVERVVERFAERLLIQRYGVVVVARPRINNHDPVDHRKDVQHRHGVSDLADTLAHHQRVLVVLVEGVIVDEIVDKELLVEELVFVAGIDELHSTTASLLDQQFADRLVGLARKLKARPDGVTAVVIAPGVGVISQQRTSLADAKNIDASIRLCGRSGGQSSRRWNSGRARNARRFCFFAYGGAIAVVGFQINANHQLENVTFNATGAHFDVEFCVERSVALEFPRRRGRQFVCLVFHIQANLLFVVHEYRAEMGGN